MVNNVLALRQLNARLLWAVLLVGLVLVALLALTLLSGGHPHLTQTLASTASNGSTTDAWTLNFD